ncbi:MAG: phosphate signaling complex protein PhoU [Ardenticatenaceae bacterium]|nr:phosphate signaling complex protein PhoU [Ardenticatenaceae bacterium]MCB9444840.1 phosphate signaling complex protein PhoU [Ardenticatenaceae bacterium]
MIRTTYEKELQRLEDQIISLGSEVEANIVKSIEALVQRDLTRSQQFITADVKINEQRIQIGLDCLSLIARQQPMAGDMRLIAAIIEIVGELERIHDYVKGIGKISLMLGERNILPAISELLPQMALHTRDMLHRALDAFTNRDADLARGIPANDDKVDALYNRIYCEIITYVTENSAEVEHANRLEWASHNLERSADRVSNICEWIIYMIDGKYVELDSEIEAPPSL